MISKLEVKKALVFIFSNFSLRYDASHCAKKNKVCTLLCKQNVSKFQIFCLHIHGSCLWLLVAEI